MELLFLSACFLASLAYVAVSTLRDTLRDARRERDAALAAERAAYERLLVAHKDGYEIPTAPPVIAPLDEEPAPYLPAIQDYLDDWEGDAKAAAKGQIDTMLRLGATQADVVRRLHLDRPDEVAVE